MTIEHNVVVVGGLEYKAVSISEKGCHGCAGHKNDLCGALEACVGESRVDGADVRYKRHYRPTHKELQKWKY